MKIPRKTSIGAQSLSDLSPDLFEIVRQMYGTSYKEERSRLTCEALIDVDTGHVIDHHAVQAWANSLGTPNPLPMPR